MRTRSPLRPLRALAAIAAIAAGTTLVPASPGAAADHPPVELDSSKDVKNHYPGIAGQGQVNQIVAGELNESHGLEPKDCNPSFCDSIPVKVKVPADFSKETFYAVVTATLSWEDANDMDLYAFYKGKDDEGNEVDTLAASSAGSTNPEQLRTEQLGFTLYVVNSSGANPQGYDITLHLDIERLERPQEAPEQAAGGFGPGTGFGGGAPIVPVVGSSGFPAAPPTPVLGGGPARPALPVAAPEVVAPSSPLESPPSAVPGAVTLDGIDLVGDRRRKVGEVALGGLPQDLEDARSGDVSTTAIVGTLVALPGALLIGLGSVVGLRRRRAALP